MRDQTQYREIAKVLFDRVRSEHAELHSELSFDPIPEIQLELTFGSQPDLIFPVSAALQSDELCLSVGETFFGEWFPCSDPEVAEQFRTCLTGVLSGNVRLVDTIRKGQVVQSRLEEHSRGRWRPVARWMKLHWLFLQKPTTHVRRNRPSQLRNRQELDRALLADLRNYAGDIDYYVSALEAIKREARHTDLPWLRSLLKDNDECVREAVTAPIARLEGLSALRDLLLALGRSWAENHDGDSLAAVLIDMVISNPSESQRILSGLLLDKEKDVREGAQWLMDHLQAGTAD